MEDKIKNYADLKIQVKKLGEQLDEAQKEIIEFMEKEGHQEIVLSGVGKFYFTKRKVYTFPKEILDAAAAVDQMKVEAKAKGAPYTELSILTFKEQTQNGSESLGF